MRATYRLIGCALCLAGIGGAAASSLDTHDMDGSAQVMTSSSSRGSDSSGGDAAGLGHDCLPADGNDGPTGSGGGQGQSSGGASTPPSPHRPHLGWQSLLPGSIQ